jgi:hypothetical protein
MIKDYYLLEANESEQLSTQETQKMKFLDNLFDNGGDFRTSHTTLEKSMTKESGSNSQQRMQSDAVEETFDDFSIVLAGVSVISFLIFLYFLPLKWSLIASLIIAVMLVELRKYFILYDYVLNTIKDRNFDRMSEVECFSRDYNLMEI